MAKLSQAKVNKATLQFLSDTLNREKRVPDKDEIAEHLNTRFPNFNFWYEDGMQWEPKTGVDSQEFLS